VHGQPIVDRYLRYSRGLAAALGSLAIAGLSSWIPSGEAQQAPRSWRISSRPLLAIGSREQPGPEAFGSVLGATRSPSGEVTVVDGRSLELKVFSPTGKPLRVSGGKGEGPGEFRTIVAIQRCMGDSLFVYDGALFRVSVFGPGGAFVRTLDLRRWSPHGLPPYDFWCHRSGTRAFLHRSTDPPAGEGPFRPSVEISLIGPKDSVVRLGRFPASERYFKDGAAGPRPFGRRTTIGLGSRYLYVGTGDAPEVSQYSLRGEPVRTVHWTRAPVPVTATHVDWYVRAFIARRAGRVNTGEVERYLRALSWPKAFPAYDRILVDASDNLWVEDYPIPDVSQREWTVFNATGKRVAALTVPSGFRALEVGRDYVLGVWTDELDVEYVRLFTLVK